MFSGGGFFSNKFSILCSKTIQLVVHLVETIVRIYFKTVNVLFTEVNFDWWTQLHVSIQFIFRVKLIKFCNELIIFF